MGYRSTVGMVIRCGEDKQEFREMLAVLKVEGLLAEMAKEWSDEEWGYDDEQFSFYVEDVKWYDSFRAIRLVDDIWARFEDSLPASPTNGHWSGLFCRIGDDSSDIEEKNMGYSPPWEDLQIRRSIDMNRSALGTKLFEEKSNENK